MSDETKPRTDLRESQPKKMETTKGVHHSISIYAHIRPEIADEVVQWVSEGKTLRDYCRQPGKPNRRTIDEWRARDREFAQRMWRARDDGYDVIAEEALSIADQPSDHEDDVQHRKLQIWARLQLLAKWDPRRYGDKVQIGGDATGVPLVISDSERAAKIEAILAAATARLKLEQNGGFDGSRRD